MLSLLELETYLKSQAIRYKIISKDDTVVVMDADFNCSKVIKELGGIVKIAKVIKDFEYKGKSNKIKCAISNYTDEDVSDLRKDLKEYFKKEGLTVTWKKSHRKQGHLDPSELKDVLEIVVYGEYIGQTLAVFDPKEHIKRDLHRPVKRPLHSISIRLAKILLNLTESKKGRILDPFCGIGTILGEGMLLGHEMYGIDSNKTCIDGSKKNLNWLMKSYHITGSFKLFLGDATKMSQYVKKVDYVVTEPYMGPFLKKLPTEQEAKKTIIQLEPMYNQLLLELKKLRVKKAVIIVPVFLCRSKRKLKLRLDFSRFEMESIPYTTPTSRLHREILILKPKHL